MKTTWVASRRSQRDCPTKYCTNTWRLTRATNCRLPSLKTDPGGIGPPRRRISIWWNIFHWIGRFCVIWGIVFSMFLIITILTSFSLQSQKIYSTNKSYLRQLNYNMNQRRSWWCIATLLPSVWYINTRVVDFLQPASTSTSEQSSDACTMDNIYRAPTDLGRSYREYVGIMP